MVKTKKRGESDFVLRTMDILLDAEHRKLETIDPKKIKEIVENLATIEDEANASDKLKDMQRQEYKKVADKFKQYMDFLAMLDMDIVDDVRIDIENVARKKRAAETKALEDLEEPGLEPE